MSSAHVDVNALLDWVDANQLLNRVDLNELLDSTLTYPLSFAIFGVGLLGVVFNTGRRAWHDRFAGSAVVYDWGSRTIVMPAPLAEYLRRKGADT